MARAWRRIALGGARPPQRSFVRTEPGIGCEALELTGLRQLRPLLGCAAFPSVLGSSSGEGQVLVCRIWLFGGRSVCLCFTLRPPQAMATDGSRPRLQRIHSSWVPNRTPTMRLRAARDLPTARPQNTASPPLLL
jgi:hypothetical protein